MVALGGCHAAVIFIALVLVVRACLMFFIARQSKCLLACKLFQCPQMMLTMIPLLSDTDRVEQLTLPEVDNSQKMLPE